MLKTHTFPRALTNKFNTLENLIEKATKNIITEIDRRNQDFQPIKLTVLKTCANIFTQHFCSQAFDSNDPEFVEMVENYDDIFFEVNQGYAADFLPFLMPLHNKNLKRINQLTHQIRSFVLERVVKNKFDDFNDDTEPNDYVESLIKHVKNKQEPRLSWESALFALEDIIGGHCAVGNFLVKLLAYLAKEPEVQQRIQVEIAGLLGDEPVLITHRSQLPYTEAAIFEAIRLIASPIVPRVANRDSSINGKVPT